MTGSRLDWLARDVGDFVRFALLWFGLGSVTSPLRLVLSAVIGERVSWLTVWVATAALTTVVYWSVERLTWRLVGRTWFLGIVVSASSAVGLALFSPDGSTGLGVALFALCWWVLSVAVGVTLTSPTLWRAIRNRVSLRTQSEAN